VGLFHFQEENTMTIDNLFGPERKPLRLRVIKPIYESIKISEAAALYIDEATPLSSSTLVADMFSFLSRETKEHFIALHLSSKNRLLCLEIVSVGSLNASIVHPREVYKSALLSSAAAIVFVHNHPSGDPTPSREDIELTARLKEASELLGIRLLDHVIIGTDRHYSFADAGLL
jgi:DNA repair protein RadC